VIGPEIRAQVEKLREKAVAAALEEGFLDAKEVLAELIRQLARLTSQAQRLHADLGHDIGDLYRLNGQMYPIEMWPEAWRRRLVVEMETLERNVRSHDGQTAEKSGGWDVVGEVRKFKRESTLQIERTLLQVEKEIRDTLELISRHKAVDSMASTKHEVDVTVVTAEQARKLAGARQRLNRVIDVTPTTISSGVQGSASCEPMLAKQQGEGHNG